MDDLTGTERDVKGIAIDCSYIKKLWRAIIAHVLKGQGT